MAFTLGCGERVVRCLRGEPVDHVPYGVGIGWQPWGEALERWRRESGVPNLDPSRELGFEGSFALPSLRYGFAPAFEPAVISEDERFVVHRDERGIVMRNRRDGGSMPEFLSHPVRTADDWNLLKRDRLRLDDLDGRVVEDWDAFRARVRETGEAVQVGVFPYGVFGTPRDLMGVEALMLAFYEQPDLVRDMMNHLTTLWIAIWERVSRHIQIDHIHIWEDMAGKQGPLISPRMVREFMMPCYDRICDFARSAGVRIVSVDTDGDCALLVPIFMEHGVNAMLPFEAQAGCDILEFRRLYPELGIIGGLDKRALADSRQSVEAEVERAERMIACGRYVPGFDHLIPPDAPWENFRYAAERLRSVCGVP